jgi:hypothetical protein
MRLVKPNEYLPESDKSELLWKLLNAMIADRSDSKKSSPRRDSE